MFKSVKIRTKLPVLICVLVGLTILVLTIANWTLTARMITSAAVRQLTTISALNTRSVMTLLHSIDRDITLSAAAPSTYTALLALTDGYDSLEDAGTVLRDAYITSNPYELGEKDRLVQADTGSSYGFIHATYHPAFDAVQDAMGYYDIFLFSTKGDLVYSVFKENDFATNMIDGPYADSGLAEAFKKAIKNSADDPSVFVDFQPYEPSALAPAAFISRPVFGPQGVLLGVLAYQMPISQLNAAAGNLTGLGQTATGFIVGSDNLMRTESDMTEADDILKTRVDSAAVRRGFQGERSDYSGLGISGEQVMGYFAPITFLGTTWVTVIQQSRAELFAGLKRATWAAALLAAVILFVSATGAIVFSRSISRPLQSLADAVGQVAEGALDTVVPGMDRLDEVGDLARTTEVFRQNAIQMKQMGQDQAQANEKMRDLAKQQEAAALRERDMAREKDRADEAAQSARQQMMHKLERSFGNVVKAATMGDFSPRIDATFDDVVLTELSQGINSLMETVEYGLTQTGNTLRSVAEGDLTSRMHGEFQGAFSALQENVNRMAASLTDLIGDISQSGETLSLSSSELQQTADFLSRRAEQNAAAVEQTSASLKLLSSSLEQVGQTVSGVSDTARQARDAAVASNTVAEDASTSMDRIADGSREISRVIAVINDIAFQINLLALNAGVEAARAGEAGRGFSVVASEVRMLAQRAGEAASEIAEVISKSDDAVTDGVANVAKAKVSLEQIAQSVVTISDGVENVTRAMSEQATSIREISTAVSQVDQNTQKQAASLEEVTASSHLLANEAQSLRASTSKFKVDATNADAASSAPAERDVA